MSGSEYDAIPASVLAEWSGLVNFQNPPKHVDIAIPLTVVLGTMVVLIVGARAWVRVHVQRKVDISDWIVFIATVCPECRPKKPGSEISAD